MRLKIGWKNLEIKTASLESIRGNLRRKIKNSEELKKLKLP